jgi:uncharacterized sulfatase
LLTLPLANRAATPHPPDLVLFIADDYTWHDLPAYGSTDVRTPNLDQLTQQSLRFRLAYAASPTCSPSRSAIYTGLYPMRNGAHANHSLIKEGVLTLPIYMQRLGYRVVIAGKTHIGPRDQFPFEYLPNSNIMPPGKHELLYTDLNTDAVDNLLKTNDRSKPLCLLVCSHSPHVYWMDNEGFDPAKITLPPYLVDTPETRSMRCQYYTDVAHMDQQVGQVRASLAKYNYSPIFMFTADQGAQWPFAKWELYDAGIRVPLLVQWPGHIKGYTSTDALVSLIDILPTFISLAGGTPPPDLDGQSFLNVLTASSNHHRDEIFAAHTGDKEMNVAPMRCIRTGPWKYILNLTPQIPYRTHINGGGPRDGRIYWDSWVKLAQHDPHAASVVQRYTHKPAEELYNLDTDPYELTNLAPLPQYKQTVDDLREKVRLWRIQQGEDPAAKPLMPTDGRTGELKYAG